MYGIYANIYHQSTPVMLASIYYTTGSYGTISSPLSLRSLYGGFQLGQWGYPRNAGWMLMKNPIQMHDLGVPLFQETSISAVGSMLKNFECTETVDQTPAA